MSLSSFELFSSFFRVILYVLCGPYLASVETILSHSKIDIRLQLISPRRSKGQENYNFIKKNIKKGRIIVNSYLRLFNTGCRSSPLNKVER